MSDENPKSLLVLCDDTIREILSFMPLKSRVRLSGTCTAVYKVVEETMLSVHSLTDDMMRWKEDEFTESRLTTVSKMKNLRSMSLFIDLETDSWEKVVEVLVNNCHYIEHIKCWNIECVDSYVRGLHGKGLPVRLKSIQFLNSKQSHHLSSILQNTSSAKLIFHSLDFDYGFVKMSDIESRVQEMGGIYSFPFLDHFPLSGIRKLTTISIDYPHQLQQILRSMPHVNHIGLIINQESGACLQLLTDARQNFLGIDLEIEDRDFENHAKVELLLEKKGRNLRHLGLALHADQTTSDPFDCIRRSCPRLKYCDLFYNKRISCSSAYIVFRKRRLFIYQYDPEKSLRPLLALFPKVKDVAFYFRENASNMPDSWVQELREFAVRQKKYCIIAMDRGTGTAVLSFQQNLRLMQ